METHFASVSLATGLSEWDDEHAMLKERIREQIYRETGISPTKSKVNKGGFGSPEKNEVIPAHEQIWSIMQCVRQEEENAWAAGNKKKDSLQRAVRRHRESLRTEGVMNYVNKIMMPKIVKMNADIRKSVKEMVEERFEIMIVGGNPDDWRVTSNEMILLNRKGNVGCGTPLLMRRTRRRTAEH
jgi:hypothetical protein